MLKTIILLTLSIITLSSLCIGCDTPAKNEDPTAEPSPSDNIVVEPTLIPMNIVDADNHIRINQVGYKPDSPKIVVFANVDALISEFSVVSQDGEIVFTGAVSQEQVYNNSGEVIKTGDFSELTAEGIYHIEIYGYDNSYEFAISENVYDDLSTALSKMFYYQRCGMELSKEYAGEFAHGACHAENATIYDIEQIIDVTGGWHDAGDYGRYITPAAKAVIDLLLAYENAPEKYSDATGIDESGNGIPDILDEVKYELDFFLKMQDSASGGVYHKVTTASFTFSIMPDAYKDELIVCPMSGMATADFAAVMAKAYTIYSPIDKEFADICLQSAEKAWQWLIVNPHEQSFTNPQYITTGEYGDTSSEDERFWAASELYLATQKDEYHQYIKTFPIYSGLGWRNMGMYGMIAYLKLPEGAYDETLYNKILDRLIGEADTIADLCKSDLYSASLKTNEYDWGSNMTVANNGMLLLIANDCRPDAKYIDAAHEQLNYLLGKNAMGISYITNFGTNYAHNPHHRMTEAKKVCFDGLVVGGPNANMEDAYARASFPGRQPAQCYADVNKSYSTNEVTIYWNSPVVYLTDYFK